jgi:hypothetical protein
LHGGESLFEGFDLVSDAGVVAGESVEVLEDGIGGEGKLGAVGCGEVFDAIEFEEPEVVHGDSVHDQLFNIGLRLVVLGEDLAEGFEGIAIFVVEILGEEFV